MANVIAIRGPVTVYFISSSLATTPTSSSGSTGFVERAPSHAKVMTGGHAMKGDTGYFYEPTVVADLQQDDEMIQNEVFGPVIAGQRFSDEDEAVALGQRRRVRPGLDRSGRRTTGGPCGWRGGSTSAASGSTPTSRWWRRCPTAGSRSSGYGKDLSMYALRRLHPHQARHVQPGLESSSPAAALRPAPTRFARLSLRRRASLAPGPPGARLSLRRRRRALRRSTRSARQIRRRPAPRRRAGCDPYRRFSRCSGMTTASAAAHRSPRRPRRLRSGRPW